LRHSVEDVGYSYNSRDIPHQCQLHLLMDDMMTRNEPTTKNLTVNDRKYNIMQQTRMWTNAQRDGHPAEYRWRPLQSLADAHY